MIQQPFQSCIDACYACAAACDHCASACLKEPNPEAMARCIALDIDCAAICRTAAGAAARAGETADVVCNACAQVCDACAQECEKHQLQHCRQCAQACRRCADECRRMAAAMPARPQQSETAIGLAG